MRILATLFFSLTLLQFSAQGPERVLGDLLVQLYPEVDSRAWTAQYPGLELERCISTPMNVYLLHFDEEVTDAGVLLDLVRSDVKVSLAQFNHRLSSRNTVPDDAQYENQWQYNNTGQSGGTAGADLEIEEAWDITTGGVTALGDTIVVCVLDDGIDADHPDIAPNLWVNRAEIPNNGIDDDGNGFTDDYRGWDVGTQNDNVYNGGGHGTPVAGIVGAKGNNGTGVSGVSWDVKLMIVDYSLATEASTIEGYAYPLVMRQRYNETNGEEGAFVVATNSSWGIDFGQPDDSPLWCAYYDTLGVHGILNCGATINGNQNVDVVGDLPTACPSDYMISVTNMNHFDVKVNSAGYGIETIDLGAFGQGTWNVQAGGGYGGFGGTSGATPHVAGTIGLIYSLPCPGLIELANENPQAAADLVREAIFETVEPNASLEGITATGGRLNVKQVIEFMAAAYCSCPPPVAIALDAVDGESATLNWNDIGSIETIDFEWRAEGEDEWQLVEGVSSPLVLSGLNACTVYEYRLRSFCDEDTSDYSITGTILTDGCCENPEQLAVTSTTENTVLLTWESVLAAEGYTIRIRPTDGGDWVEIESSIEALLVNQLEACTEYEAQIQIGCTGDETDFTESIVFTTKGCGACEDEVYCSTDELDNSEEWIAQVEIADLNSISEAGNAGYEDFSGTEATTELIIGNTYPMTVTVDYSGFIYTDNIKVYLDYNQNGLFNEATEVIAEGETIDGIFSTTVEIEEMFADVGTTRMRVVMSYNTEGDACDVDWQYGEIEDYCVTLVDATSTTDLDIPAGLSVYPNPSSGQVRIEWLGEPLTLGGLSISDATGRVILREAWNGDSQWTSESTLPAGIYFIRVWEGNKELAVQRLIRLK